MRKRILSMLLCIMMCIIILPMMIFANVINNKVYAVLDDDGTMTIGAWDTKPEGAYEFSILKSVNSPDEIPWYNKRKIIKKVEFDSSIKNYKPTSLNYWFYDCNALLTVSNTEYLDTSSVTDMCCMFDSCSSLTTLDVSNWDTSSVTVMNSMFSSCSSLTTLDLSGWDTSSVTDMSYMFYYCSPLTTLDVSKWDTSAVTNMACMFYGCHSLTTLDLSGWDTSSVTDMSEMFYHCHLLTTLGVSNWDTSSVTNMACMFDSCSSLTTLDVSEWDTSSVTDMSHMFYYCSSLTTLDVSKWDTSAVTDMSTMFWICPSLTTLDVSKWDTSSVTDMCSMFSSSSSLTTLDLSGWNTSSVMDMSWMFNGCSSLTTLDVSNWDTSSVTVMDSMFRSCSSLTTLDLSGWNTSSVMDMSWMFNGCSSLTTLDLSGWDMSSVGYDSENYITGISSMFLDCSKLKTIYVSNNLTLSDSATENSYDVFKNCTSLTGGAGTVYKDIYNTYDVNDTNYAHIDGGTSNPGYFTFGYHITFDIGEGTTGEAPESVFVTTGKQIILPSASSLFLKVGYKFIGWSDGTKTYEAGTTFTVGTEVVNFTAVWEKCSDAHDVYNYNVWVNGYRFTTEVPFIVCGEGTAVFNPANNTLTLNNATITNEYYDYENHFGGGIASDGPLTIVLEGKNVIDFTNKEGRGDGIFVSGDLTLTGAGSLDIIGCTTGIYTDEGDTNIDMDGDLYINTYWGDFYCIIAGCDINISGSGNIELISGANYDCGLEAYGSCNISGSGNLSIKASDWGILTLGGGTNISGDRNITIDSLNSCIFAQYADINITGSGDITLNGMHASGIYVQLETASPTHIYVNTSGKLTINARDYGMYEPHNIIIEGTGDIEINSNVGLAVDTLESLISVAGSGNVVINSAASGISSFGDVKISSNGHVDITSEGSVGIGVGNGMLDVSGNGTLNVTSKADAAIDILNTSEKLVLNGNNREVAFTSAPGFSAVYNSITQDKFPVTLLNGDRYIIIGSPEESSVVYSMEYYIVNFEMNGHGTAPAEQRVVDGNTATKPDEPCADGWTFDGWYVDSLFTTPFDFDSAITSDTELYAKWTCKHADTEIKDVKEATCTADGYTGDTYCKVCGEKLEEGEVIPAGHIWENDFTVDKEPTYTEEGSKSIHCTKCGATKDVTAIPTLTSEPTNTPTPTPTPTPEPTTTPAPELNVGDFVTRCYEVALGRDADEGGYDYWKNQLINGEVCGSQAAFGFIFSTEYANKDTTNEQFVTDMYSMLFGRKPDEAGYNYWLEQLNGETATREQVFAGFANSEEFYNLCNKYGVVSGAYIDGVSNEQQGGVNCFVARLYKVCLNRLPDQGGQAGWVQKLINGELSGSTCAYGFVFSEEFTNMNLDNTDFVKNMYAAFFGREADEEGLNYWVDMLNGGTATREDVFNGFTGSPEFANLCASYGINV